MLAATWVAAATVVLALGAIVTSVFAVRAFLRRAEEVGLIKQQLDDQRRANDRQADVLELPAKELRESPPSASATGNCGTGPRRNAFPHDPLHRRQAEALLRRGHERQRPARLQSDGHPQWPSRHRPCLLPVRRSLASRELGGHYLQRDSRSSRQAIGRLGDR